MNERNELNYIIIIIIIIINNLLIKYRFCER